ncbi:MAG: DUF4301 family protein [Desulfobacteraceae bacterium]|nr:DUF4301 family protein [Desulfobacteraceae bacterium]MBC2754957.1 DUF4301 family protein [Desulfobacteraceae bacterium]
MNQVKFSKNDIEQIKKTGQTPGQIYSQLSLFHQGTPFVHLDRPCTVGDGIKRLPNDVAKQCIHLFETQGIKKKLIKFVPASGAATRMFKKLIHAYHTTQNSEQTQAAMAKKIRNDLSHFMNNCRRFAFYDDLKASVSEEKISLETLLAAQNSEKILRHLLTEKYLNYAMLPKGLIRFHSYENHTRTAFEEHLVEAGGYARTSANKCKLHFTVSPRHKKKFLTFFQKIQSNYEDQLGTNFDVSFSTQKLNTNTIAVDSQNRPFRLSDGHLLFRPGGHGALINNLNQLDGDIVFIKNVDNVAHGRLIDETIEWKKILCGYLMQLQQQIFNFLNQLHQQPISEAPALEITGFLKKKLSCRLPEDFKSASNKKKQKTLIHLLNRPLRVCGMVPNTGEPGGGPFWTKDNENNISLQIVEVSQIDTDDKHQKSILNQLTHFNPVDLVCSIKNWRDELFDLSEYVDHQAVFISNKSENGRDLKALELPGLWNGAMAFWNTAFVEVPKITFNPVKEVTDLLGAHHQPAS